MQGICRAQEQCEVASSDQRHRIVKLMDGKVCTIPTLMTLLQEAYLFLPNGLIFCKTDMIFLLTSEQLHFAALQLGAVR